MHTLSAAKHVLARNWVGSHTVPATGLYPHQWSWDSAFIAIGTRHIAPDNARTELLSLLDAQWDDGRIPQIIYDVSRDDDYAPGDAFWQSRSIDGSSQRPSAGFTQPPNHAWAAWLVHCSDPEGSRASGFLETIYPGLVRWHDYLASDRASRRDSVLSVIKHPWESGTDNSPLWDDALKRIPADPVTQIRRPDLVHAGDGERPGERDYRRYYWLAERYRDGGCQDGEAFPFEMVCPLFNSLRAVSELALAQIATELGLPDAKHHAAASAIANALDAELWDAGLGIYVARDDVSGTLVSKATVNGLVPLIMPGLAHADELVSTITGPRFLGSMRFVPSYDATAADFDPALYWRGPAWFNMNWLIMRALEGRGHDDVAARIKPMFTDLAADDNFPEYVDPATGTARGTRNFSWTAALLIDTMTVPRLEVATSPAPR